MSDLNSEKLRAMISILMGEDPEQAMISRRFAQTEAAGQNPRNFQNPFKQAFTEGAMGLRSLGGLPPTEDQRMNDAFYQLREQELNRFRGR
jgi:hypothetical protein